jgi:hypothetical protein
MAYTSWHRLISVDIEIAAVFHPLLGKIEHVARRVVGADTRKGSVARSLEHSNSGVFFFQAGKDQLNVLDFEAEVIEAGLAAGSSGVNVDADVAVAHDYSTTWACHTRPFQTENFAVKIAFLVYVAADDGQVPHLCKHPWDPFFAR